MERRDQIYDPALSALLPHSEWVVMAWEEKAGKAANSELQLYKSGILRAWARVSVDPLTRVWADLGNIVHMEENRFINFCKVWHI